VVLKNLFPSASVERDTFERKHRQLDEAVAELSDQGDTIRNPDLLCRVLTRGEEESGPGVDVSILLDGAVKISGSVLTGGISLSS
jgi:hypothetical protein